MIHTEPVPPPGLEGTRRQVLLCSASHWLGTSSYLLEKEVRAAGYPILGYGRGRRCYVDDLLVVQFRMDQEARRKAEKRAKRGAS